MWWYLKEEVNFNFRRKLKTRVAPLEKAWLYEGSVHPHGEKNPRPLQWVDHSLKNKNGRTQRSRGGGHRTSLCSKSEEPTTTTTIKYQCDPFLVE
jgi:hypothetical protein